MEFNIDSEWDFECSGHVYEETDSVEVLPGMYKQMQTLTHVDNFTITFRGIDVTSAFSEDEIEDLTRKYIRWKNE